MHKTAAEGAALARSIRTGLDGQAASVDVLVAPPFTALHSVAAVLAGSPIALAAQNMHFEKEGAFTGEVSPLMLREAGCTHVILGHSERRHLFHEGDELVARKVRAALGHGLTPILCVGETLDERETSRTLEVVGRQVDHVLRELDPKAVGDLILAYEPVWAIGTGHAATPAQAQEVHAFIRKRVASYEGGTGDDLRILYGGSVKPDNIAAIMAQADIDGALVGGACLQAESFLKLIDIARPTS
jgi:triosephosphate isomerase